MKILVGSTGLVGQTLRRQMYFDFLFNSTNMNKFGESFSDGHDLYLTCLPATKWLVNQSIDSKISDFINCLKIIGVLSKRSYNNIVLISSIDVYLNSELGSDEDTEITNSGLGYSENRLMFEKLVEKELKYNSLKIYRLPALFGEGLKKNILFDIMNNKNLGSINNNSYYQWYNLDRLREDIRTYEKVDGSVVNLFTEPIFTKDIIDRNFGNRIGFMSESPVVYNYKTKFSESGYIDSADNVLRDIEKFIYANRG